GLSQIYRKQHKSDPPILAMSPSDSSISQSHFGSTVHGGRASVYHAEPQLSIRHIWSCSALGDFGSTPTLGPSPTASATTGTQPSGSGRKRHPSWGGHETDREGEEWSNQPQS